MIPFNKPPALSNELENIQQVLKNNYFTSSGYFTLKLEHLLV